MREIGTVTKVSEKYSTVKIDRTSECDKCGLCGMKKDMAYVEINATDKLNAKVGDRVEVETSGKTKTFAVFLSFLVPLLLIGITVVIGLLLALNDLITLGISVGVVVVWYVVLGLIDKKLAKIEKFCPEIVKIIGE